MSYFKNFLLLALIPVLFLGAWQLGDFLNVSVFQGSLVGGKTPVTLAFENVRVEDVKTLEAAPKELRQGNENRKGDSSAELAFAIGEVGYVAPMGQAEKRITKKTFGLYVTPETSPVQPDKFRGFHAGVDWEVFAKELDKDVPVQAVCSGPLKLKKMASGYGGVAVQQCNLDGEPITVIYGHMKLSSIEAEVGKAVSAGEIIGLLGADKSPETDGRRKHLHLAFHRTGKIDIKGYLPTERELDDWIDPCLYVCK